MTDLAQVLTSLLLIVAVAFVSPLVSWTVPKRLVPEVVLLILGGMVIGPHGLGLAGEGPSIELLRELGVAFLFLMAGYEIDVNELRGAGGRHAAIAWMLSLGLAFGAVTVIGVTGGAASANGVAIAIAMTSTAIGTILPILRDRGLLPTAVGASILNHGAVGEVGPILLMAILLGSRSTWVSLVILAAFLIITLLIIRFTSRVKRAGRRLVEVIHLGASTTAQTTIRATVLLLVGLCAIAAVFDLDVVLGAFAAGFVLRHALPEGDAQFEEKLDGLAYGFFVPIFFVTSGMGIDMSLSAGDLVNLLAFFVLLVLVRGVPVWLASRVERRRDGSRAYSMRQSLQIAVYSTTALPIIVAVTQVAVSAEAMSTSFASTLVLAGVLSVLVLPAAGLVLEHRSDHVPANEVMRVAQGPAAPDGRTPEEATAPAGEHVSEPRRPASPPGGIGLPAGVRTPAGGVRRPAQPDLVGRPDLRERVAPVAVRLADPGLHVRGLSVEESHWLAARLAQSGQDHALWRERWHHLRRRGGTARAARRRRPRGE
ncbi:cation:proton antiporter [Actinomyces sp. Marseille-P3109]|uniref:cation:proton antiporter n=1 Tax=Actinomyces sp. Marseille-P3109 TaxID=2083009 RepID=UPI000D54CFE1|nr:cation:proton antiporter [Actinomyces sp. Marseille-P3109]